MEYFKEDIIDLGNQNLFNQFKSQLESMQLREPKYKQAITNMKSTIKDIENKFNKMVKMSQIVIMKHNYCYHQFTSLNNNMAAGL